MTDTLTPLVELVEDDTANCLKLTATIWSADSMSVTVVVRIQRGRSYWERPPAQELRAFARRAATEAGRRLTGQARYEHTDGPVTAWRFTYWLAPKEL